MNITRGSRVRWEALGTDALVISTEGRAQSALISPDYNHSDLATVDIRFLRALP